MAAINLGVSIRDNLMIVGYLEDWLIAVDEHGNYFAAEEKAHLYEIGTVFKEELMEVKNLYGV